MLFKKSVSSVVKAFVQARLDLEAVIADNNKLIDKTIKADKEDYTFKKKVISLVHQWQTKRFNKNAIKRSAYNKEIAEANKWLASLPSNKGD